MTLNIDLLAYADDCDRDYTPERVAAIHAATQAYVHNLSLLGMTVTGGLTGWPEKGAGLSVSVSSQSGLGAVHDAIARHAAANTTN